MGCKRMYLHDSGGVRELRIVLRRDVCALAQHLLHLPLQLLLHLSRITSAPLLSLHTHIHTHTHLGLPRGGVREVGWHTTGYRTCSRCQRTRESLCGRR